MSENRKNPPKAQDSAEFVPKDAKFRHRLRTRFFEVDQHGQVHNAYYLVYAEQAITEFLKARQCGDLIAPGAEGCIYVIARTAIDYLAPLGFDSNVAIAVWVSRLGRSSITFSAAICRDGDSETPAAKAEIVWVYKDSATGRSTALKSDLVERLEGAVFAGAPGT